LREIERIEMGLSPTLDFRYVNDGREARFWLDRHSEQCVSFTVKEATDLLDLLEKVLAILPDGDDETG